MHGHVLGGLVMKGDGPGMDTNKPMAKPAFDAIALAWR